MRKSALTILVIVSEPTATAYSAWAVSSIFLNRSEKREELETRRTGSEGFPNFSAGIAKPPVTRSYYFELKSQSGAREAQAEHTRHLRYCVESIERGLPTGYDWDPEEAAA